MIPRERPILFSGPMVRAILEGRKTVTRRIVKPQPANGCRYEMNGAGTHALHLAYEEPNIVFVPPTPRSVDHRLQCPYVARGRLWVKETFGTLKGNGIRTVYRADADPPMSMLGEPIQNMRWRPSIFMRRTDSRILLEVTDVQVERLHAITEEDAQREGVRPFFESFQGIGRDQRITSGELAADAEHRAAFAVLWDEINGDRASWASNPWVWRVAFQRLT